MTLDGKKILCFDWLKDSLDEWQRTTLRLRYVYATFTLRLRYVYVACGTLMAACEGKQSHHFKNSFPVFSTKEHSNMDL